MTYLYKSCTEPTVVRYCSETNERGLISTVLYPLEEFFIHCVLLDGRPPVGCDELARTVHDNEVRYADQAERLRQRFLEIAFIYIVNLC